MEAVWCVKHKDGWCATNADEKWDDRSFNVPTACKHFIVLPLGCQRREPTCLECVAALTAAETEVF